MGRRVPLLVGVVLSSVVASGAAAQSPSPSPSAVPASPIPIASPGAPLGTASPPPMLPPRGKAPAWTPTGRPDAVVRRGGVVLRVWVRDRSVAPGEWVQAAVRVRYVGRQARFHEPDGCDTSPITLDLELITLFDPGREWPGLAGEYKAQLSAGDGMPGWVLSEDRGSAAALAECINPRSLVGVLEPGGRIGRRASWRPTYLLRRPLPPGPMALEVRFNDWGGGDRPDRRHKPLVARVPLTMVGEDTGYPSPLVLIDRALEQPEFFAFVTEDPGDRYWDPHWIAWDSLRSFQARWAGLAGRVPNGFLEIGLFRDDAAANTRFAVVNIDPWTGEVLSYGEQSP